MKNYRIDISINNVNSKDLNTGSEVFLYNTDDLKQISINGDTCTNEIPKDECKFEIYLENGDFKTSLVFKNQKIFFGSNFEQMTNNQLEFTKSFIELIDAIKKNIINNIDFFTFFRLTSEREKKRFLDKLKKGLSDNESLSLTEFFIILNRKKALEEFRKRIDRNENEDSWSKFFIMNPWIFGNTLDYKFLRVIRKEPNVETIRVDKLGGTKSDFLLGCENFLVLVEIKRPSTPLFRTREENLSDELSGAVSQVLREKYCFEITGNNPIAMNNIKQKSYDPKVILVIGRSTDFEGDSLFMEKRKKKFELFRRNSKNIDIITYDEIQKRMEALIQQR